MSCHPFAPASEIVDEQRRDDIGRGSTTTDRRGRHLEFDREPRLRCSSNCKVCSDAGCDLGDVVAGGVVGWGCCRWRPARRPLAEDATEGDDGEG